MKLLPAVVIALVLVTGSQAGCRIRGDDKSVRIDIPVGQGIDIAREFRPDALPYSKCNLIVAGTEITAKLERLQAKETFDLLIKAHGVEIERESYRFNNYGLYLIDAAGETYDPAIQLIPRSLTSERTWTWEGTSSFEVSAKPSSGRRAKANISVTDEGLNLPGVSSSGLKIEVTLNYLAEGGGPPAERKLLFWLAKEQGIVKRQFGFASTREPLRAEP